MTEIINLDTKHDAIVDQLATVTFEAFKENAPDWLPTIDDARARVVAAGSHGRFGRVIIEQGKALGWVGVIKGKHVWEIHPIAVAVKRQYKGLGHSLVEDIARLAKRASVLTLFAGTSDEVGTTNLFGADLYADPSRWIKNLRAVGRNPYKFWEAAGFTVVGLMPDEEGAGKPGIQMARRL